MWGIVYFYTRNRNQCFMAVHFIGSTDAKIDVKGRVFFPAGFRKVMQEAGEEGIIMRKDIFQDCLVLYPESVWKEQLLVLRNKLNRWNNREQQLFRQFTADAEILSTDANGRILIPRRYRERIGILQEVRFIGMDDTIEIWAKEKVEDPFIPAEDFGKELEQLMNTDE